VHAALGGGSSRADADALGAVGGSALVHGDLGTQRELSASSSAVGHEVLTSSSVDGAIRLLREDEFEVVVLSLAAADAGSADALGLLRAVSDVPLIVLDGAASHEIQDSMFDSGADDYLVDPVDLTELNRLVRALVRRTATRVKGPADLTMQVRAHEVLVGSVRLALASKESSTPSIVSGAPWRGGGDGTDFAERLGP
jgi:DNA-binding response OmpR family regulator